MFLRGCQECNKVQKELMKLRTQGVQKEKQTSQDGAPEAAEQTDGSTDQAADMDGYVLDENEGRPAQDPIFEKAAALALPDLMRISTVQDASALGNDLLMDCGTDCKICYLIDTPTSRPRVLCDLIQKVKNSVGAFPSGKQEDWALAVSCGRRLDLLSMAKQNLVVNFPGKRIFVVTCTASADEQSLRKQPTYYAFVKGAKLELHRFAEL